MVVIKRDYFHSTMKVFRVIGFFCAKIINLVVGTMLGVEDALNLPEGISVNCPHVLRREGHGNQAVSDIRHVQIEASHDIPVLLDLCLVTF